MFNKLVSNLPFNRTTLGQVSFYAKRLKAESTIRRLGLIFLALGFVVQLFAMSLPASADVSGTSNDIVWGGIGYNKGANPVQNMLNVYDADNDGHNTGIQSVLTAFDISRTDIQSATIGTINSNDHTLYSLGRLPHSSLDNQMNIAGQTYYLRPLYTWGDNVTYNVIQGERAGVAASAPDKYFAIMFNCGNIVIRYIAPPAAPATPNLTIPNKYVLPTGPYPADNSVVHRGQTLGYRIAWSNNGGGAATNVMLVDHIPNDTTESFIGGGGQLTGNQAIWSFPSMAGGAQNWYEDMTVTVNNSAYNGEQICNEAYLNSAQTPTTVSQQVCFTVSVPETPTPTPTPTPPGPTPLPNIVLNKTAANLTQNLPNAQTKAAQAGDLISYTLTTQNTGKGVQKNYVVKDNLEYVLQYSTVQNISDNGTVANNVISWPAVNVLPNTTITRTFEVKVDNPIPTTNAPLTSDTNTYDMKMVNVYGTTVTIPLVVPAVLTTVAQPSNTLVNTGPGTSVIIVFVVTVIAGYFFSRSRLLAKEARLVVEDYNKGEI